MTSRTYDLIIVGGGIGGSALAVTMARAGYEVLVLEKSTVYRDVVRGEWIAPWGVAEVRRLGLYDLLMRAGGHHVTRHVTYDETRSPEASEATAQALGKFVEGIPGPLCIGHPLHCQTLFDEAGHAGAETVRGADVTEIVNGAAPSVTFSAQGATRTVTARLIVGADGRTSPTRQAADIRLSLDKPHHWFAGLLVEGADGWDASTQCIGTEDRLGFLVFPQGNGRVRLYGGYALEESKRFAGPEGPRRFLDALDVRCSPDNRHLAQARPAGPLYSYFNHSSWTKVPCRGRILLIGDAAGWNDPINGLGLSITYRDVRVVSDILKNTAEWSGAAFEPYADERGERMRRLQFAGQMVARIDMEFGAAARARRRRFLDRYQVESSVGLHLFAVMAGPERVAETTFTENYMAEVLGEAPV